MNAALEQVRDAAGELDDLLAAGHLAERVGQHLAVLGGDDRRQLALAGVQQLAEREQDLGPLGQRGVPPPREGRRRGGHDRLDVVLAGEGHLGRHLPRRRVGHVAEAAAGALVRGPALPVVQCACHGQSSLTRGFGTRCIMRSVATFQVRAGSVVMVGRFQVRRGDPRRLCGAARRRRRVQATRRPWHRCGAASTPGLADRDGRVAVPGAGPVDGAPPGRRPPSAAARCRTPSRSARTKPGAIAPPQRPSADLTAGSGPAR